MAFSTSHNAHTAAKATMQVKRNRGRAQRRSAAAIPPVRPPLTRKMTANPQGIAITLKYWTLR